MNGEPSDNRKENLRLLCRSCNVAEENKQRNPTADVHDRLVQSGYLSTEASTGVDVGVGEEGSPTTRVIKQAAGYRDGSPEMRANRLMEPIFREWVLSTVKARTFISRQDAIDSGAELCGCSTNTASRYLAKLVSTVGPLKVVLDSLDNTVIMAKEIVSFDSGQADTTTKAAQARMNGAGFQRGPHD